MANTSGGIALSRNYEPYGTIYSAMGISNTAYGFTSEWADGTGLVNLRARYYAPIQGRFVSQDRWVGDYENPHTLNKWNYVEANPINRVDPLGLCSIQDEACLEISRELKMKFGWNVMGSWQLSDVKRFSVAASLISSFFDTHGGNGAGRMRAISPVYIGPANNFWNTLGYHHVLGRKIELLPSFSKENIIHEFAHIIDNVTGSSALASIIGGGPSDGMARSLGVDPTKCNIRFLCNGYKQMIRDANAELPFYDYAYNGPSEDFATTFEKLLVSDSRILSQNPIRVAWMTNYIEQYQQSSDMFFVPLPVPIPDCTIPEVLRTPQPSGTYTPGGG